MSANTDSECAKFLDSFVPKMADLDRKIQEASWELFTRSSPEAEDRFAKAMTEYELLFNDQRAYEAVLALNQGSVSDPLLARQLGILTLEFKKNAALPKELIEEISEKEAATESAFINFRAELHGEKVTNNDINHVLEISRDVAKRKEAWRASKQVGAALAPRVIELAKLRNRAARIAGFENYFEMSYKLDELDPNSIIALFESAIERTAEEWQKLLGEIESVQTERFGVERNELGPWAWSDPFSQDDPIFSNEDGDKLFKGKDLVEAVVRFYAGIGFDISGVIKRSDLFSRDGKSPHAFCFDMDRSGDARILANIVPTHGWFQTMMHESGHAIEFLGHDPKLPWLLRNCSHTLTTEAMAELGGSFASEPKALSALFKIGEADNDILLELQRNRVRHQLIFVRWAMVVTSFEKHLYENPDADHQAFWWDLVEKYQNISRPQGRENEMDWAAKIHISTSPCYYQNYFLANLFRSQINAKLRNEIPGGIYGNPMVGKFLKEVFFAPGASLPWWTLVERVSGKPLGIEDWANEVSS